MATLVLLVTVAFVWFVLPFVIKKIQIDQLRGRCAARRVIALTYDDGPSERMTASLLDILGAYNAVATFYLLGRNVEGQKANIGRMVQAGHEIGSHSFRHLNAWKRNPVSVFLDIRAGLGAVRAVAQCRLFRAPQGKMTLATWIQTSILGCRQSWWTIDSTDTWKTPRTVNEILDQVRRQGGGVILMHDLDRPGHPEREEFVVNLTRGLLDLAQAEGFQICKLGEVLQ